jgi:hypothetical protein
MRVPLPGIVAILSSNHPGIASQGAVYDFVLRWADSHYPNSEERRKILSSRLLPLVPQECSKTNANLIDQPSCIVNFILKREQCSPGSTSTHQDRYARHHSIVQGMVSSSRCNV